MTPIVRALAADDPPTIAAAFEAIGWDKPQAKYEQYLAQQAEGARDVFVADLDGGFAGYVTLLWRSPYAPFRGAQIPEIQDLNVLPAFRRRGVGTALLDAAERRVAHRGDVVGIGVGMDADYGPAQAMYVNRGYVPDARGLTSKGRHLRWGETVTVDDDLVLYFTKSLR